MSDDNLARIFFENETNKSRGVDIARNVKCVAVSAGVTENTVTDQYIFEATFQNTTFSKIAQIESYVNKMILTEKMDSEWNAAIGFDRNAQLLFLCYNQYLKSRITSRTKRTLITRAQLQNLVRNVLFPLVLNFIEPSMLEKLENGNSTFWNVAPQI